MPFSGMPLPTISPALTTPDFDAADIVAGPIVSAAG
jgi:putative SOS response-associated peptidase YedK